MKTWFVALFVAVSCMLVPLASFAQDSAAAADTAAPNVETIIELIENPETRQALIDSLRAAVGPVDAAPVDTEEDTSIGRFIAETTTEAAQLAAASVMALWTSILDAPEAFRGLSTEQIEVLLAALQSLALVIVTTVVAYLSLRVYFRRIARRIGAQNSDAGILRSFSMLVGVTLLDALVVILAWSVGYLAALFVYGEYGTIGVRQSLYLNAFLIVGMVRVLIRAVLSPTAPELRFLHISTAAARTMARWFGVIASILGYGQLLIVPIVNRQASLEAGRGISTLLALVAILLAVWLTMRSRQAVASWLLTPEAEAKPGVARFLARRWHIPVLIYLFALFLIVAARPDGLIWPVLISSAQVIGVVVAGGFLSGAMTRYIAHGVHLPPSITQRLPALEGRLNAFVPKALFVLRALVLFGVIFFAMSAVGLFDLSAWSSGEGGRRAASTFASVTIMLLVGFGLWLALVSWVDYRLNPDFGTVPTSREQTLLTLLRNAATVLLLVIVLMFVLSELGVDIAPLIASAGVLGLAIGFGAQKLVQDIITGIFIQFENMMNVGDVVTLGGTTGVVEKLTIRSVSLRDVHGAFHVIPFSSVDMVSNYVKDYGMFVADIGIAYRESVADGKQAMIDAFEELKGGEFGKYVIGDFQWFGVQSLGDSAVVLRARIKTIAGQQWGVGREYNEICKRIMDERGIEIPYPHQTVYFGADKSGTATPLRVIKDEPETGSGGNPA
jgi:small conductance mechanosensitive channel